MENIYFYLKIYDWSNETCLIPGPDWQNLPLFDRIFNSYHGDSYTKKTSTVESFIFADH